MSLPLFRPLRYRDHPLVSRPQARVEPESCPLIPDFDALASDSFDPSRVHPSIRAFYERSEGSHVTLEWLRWERWALPLALGYVPAARRLGNLCVPDRVDVPVRMGHSVRPTEDGGRRWTRTFSGTAETFYSATFRVWLEPSGEATYLSMVFPFPRRTAVLVVLRLRNEGDGMVASTREGGRSGTWGLVVGRRHFVALPGPPTQEVLSFTADGDQVHTLHEDFLGKRRAFALEYRIDL